MVLTERQVLTEQTVKMPTVRTEDIVGGYVLIIKVGDKETRITILNGTMVLTVQMVHQWS
jgi:hypothetical protein